MSGGILITGAEGFVGQHLRAELGEHAVPADTDVTDVDALAETVRVTQPAAVVHLAAVASVASSWESETEVWRVNTLGTVNVLTAVRREQPAARALVVSTGEVYGRAEHVPTPEESAVAPLSPYAASKAAAEVACQHAARVDGLDVVVTRSFAHAGPGQDERFAIGSWTRQIAEAELAGGGTLYVGELSARRDITDVRDVCRAYRLLLDPGVRAGTYNVASGTAVPMSTIVDLLVGLARAPIAVERDPARLRRAELAVVCGDPSRLSRATGWQPEIPLEQTLADALDAAREVVEAERMANA